NVVRAAAVPWRLLFSKPAVWALVLNHFCSNWTLYVLLTWLPSYFSKVQHLPISTVGLFSAAPWLTMLVVTNIVANRADAMIRKGASVTFGGKLMQVIGLLGAAAFLLWVVNAESAMEALVLLCGALGALAFT